MTEREQIVAWLREDAGRRSAGSDIKYLLYSYANRIERGDHLGKDGLAKRS